MVTADIQEAYTNIDDDMIKKAIGIVCKYVRSYEWAIELMKKLVDPQRDSTCEYICYYSLYYDYVSF